jgi:hypothetical protein
MPTKKRLVAFALACAVGVGAALLPSLFGRRDFTREEAEAKVGKRVRLLVGQTDQPLLGDGDGAERKIINRGVVAEAREYRGESELIIEFDEQLPGWTSRRVRASRQAYGEAILEE